MPGQWQTILRAELTAVIIPPQYSIQADQPARIWCDNATMVRRMLYMQAGRFFQQNTLADHELRGPLHEFLLRSAQSRFQFSKSHRIRQRFFFIMGVSGQPSCGFSCFIVSVSAALSCAAGTVASGQSSQSHVQDSTGAFGFLRQSRSVCCPVDGE